MSQGYGQPPKIRFEVISEAWQLFTQQMTTWILAILVMFVAMIIPMIIMGVGIMGAIAAMSAGGRGGAALGGLGIIVMPLIGIVLMVLVGAVLSGGMYRMAIKQVRGEPIQLSDVWSVTDVLPQLLVAGLLTGLAVGLASLLCSLPAIPVGALLMLGIPLVVDQKLNAMDALKRSWEALKPEWLMASALILVLGAIAYIGSMIVIGTFFTTPLLFLGVALVYRDFILGGNTPPNGAMPGAPMDPYAPQAPTTYGEQR